MVVTLSKSPHHIKHHFNKKKGLISQDKFNFIYNTEIKNATNLSL